MSVKLGTPAATKLMNFEKEFEIAQKTIQEAAKILLSYTNKLEVSFKIDGSTLTQVDKKCEDFIISALKKSFPSYGFIAEESRFQQKDISWIIDPIDGTIAYSKGIPEYGIAIALKKDNEVIFSLASFPFSLNCYTAFKNRGTYKNNKKVTVSDVKNLSAALFSFGNENIKDHAYQQYTVTLLEKTYRFRCSYSALIDSCYIAEGKIDILCKCNQKVWDVVPQYLLMKEAGATICDIYGHPLIFDFKKEQLYSYIATNPYLFEKNKDLLVMKDKFTKVNVIEKKRNDSKSPIA